MDIYQAQMVLELLFAVKHVYDMGKMEELFSVVKQMGFPDMDTDTVDPEIAWFFYHAALGVIFDGMSSYYQEKTDTTTYVFHDAAMYRYNLLCREYEAQRGITEIENPFVKEGEKAIREAMNFGCMDYDYLWETGTTSPKQSKLVWMEGPEFCHIWEVPRGLTELKAFYQDGVVRLEKEIASYKPKKKRKGKVIRFPVPAQSEMEAA